MISTIHLRPEDRALLQRLHNQAVKAATRWWGATPGTVTRDRLQQTLDRAEARFTAALERLGEY